MAVPVLWSITDRVTQKVYTDNSTNNNNKEGYHQPQQYAYHDSGLNNLRFLYKTLWLLRKIHKYYFGYNLESVIELYLNDMVD